MNEIRLATIANEYKLRLLVSKEASHWLKNALRATTDSNPDILIRVDYFVGADVTVEGEVMSEFEIVSNTLSNMSEIVTLIKQYLDAYNIYK